MNGGPPGSAPIPTSRPTWSITGKHGLEQHVAVSTEPVGRTAVGFAVFL